MQLLRHRADPLIRPPALTEHQSTIGRAMLLEPGRIARREPFSVRRQCVFFAGFGQILKLIAAKTADAVLHADVIPVRRGALLFVHRSATAQQQQQTWHQSTANTTRHLSPPPTNVAARLNASGVTFKMAKSTVVSASHATAEFQTKKDRR